LYIYIYKDTEDLGIGIVEMLFSTSLVAIVGTGERMNSSQRRLLIANTKVFIYYFIIFYFWFYNRKKN